MDRLLRALSEDLKVPGMDGNDEAHRPSRGRKGSARIGEVLTANTPGVAEVDVYGLPFRRWHLLLLLGTAVSRTHRELSLALLGIHATGEEIGVALMEKGLALGAGRSYLVHHPLVVLLSTVEHVGRTLHLPMKGAAITCRQGRRRQKQVEPHGVVQNGHLY